MTPLLWPVWCCGEFVLGFDHGDRRPRGERQGRPEPDDAAADDENVRLLHRVQAPPVNAEFQSYAAKRPEASPSLATASARSAATSSSLSDSRSRLDGVHLTAHTGPDEHGATSGRGTGFEIALAVADHPRRPEVEVESRRGAPEHPRLRLAAVAIRAELQHFRFRMMRAEMETVDSRAESAQAIRRSGREPYRPIRE